MAITLTKTDRKNISSIEAFFDSLFRSVGNTTKLTKNLFFGELPSSLGDNWKEAVVVDCGNPMIDKDAYGKQTVLVFLYTKQNAYGKKDVKTMQDLEIKLNSLVENSSDSHYHISLNGRYSNYSAVNDVFVNVIQINLIIS